MYECIQEYEKLLPHLPRFGQWTLVSQLAEIIQLNIIAKWSVFDECAQEEVRCLIQFELINCLKLAQFELSFEFKSVFLRRNWNFVFGQQNSLQAIKIEMPSHWPFFKLNKLFSSSKLEVNIFWT